MIVYVKKPKYGDFVKNSQRSAYHGFEALGYDVETYENIKDVPKNKENLLVSGLDETIKWLNDLEINPPLIDYPESLVQFLGRTIKLTTLDMLEFYFYTLYECKRLFIKPYQEKQFEPSIIETEEDFKKLSRLPSNTQIWISEYKHFDAEYRCYISDNRVLGILKYRGYSNVQPDLKYVQQMVNSYKNAPAGYTLDIGITDKNETLLIEINDGFSIENYGLDDIKYSLLLLNRWDELMK